MNSALDRRSDQFLGRYQALRVYDAIGKFQKDEFTAGELRGVTDVPGPVISRELSRLVELGVIERASRRGDYVRRPGHAFWEAMALLVTAWNDPTDPAEP